ncbi:hypothetical protein [Streptomyces sp. CC208A]|uniref:hypothetical protein n=1 Tax=Streptomyces sp. CC208A TaxID=3044573 RepID=UPI0024A7CEB9|nr:hypothetical protein [Streptomyces sp. CC208A]
MATERRTAGKIREAEDARDALCAALRQAGIQLPAMDVCTPSRVDGARYALVALGDCSAPVVLELAAVIERGAVR